ncbi:MAG: hypothetical protein ACK5TU_14870 [Cyclobacteriaceae bacterium]|jgi:hypothetical protein
MDSNELKELLEKYWNCETSLEEEQKLHSFFRGSVPPEMNETAELFRYFELQRRTKIEASGFDEEVKQKIKEHRPAGRSVKMYFNYARIAAGIAVVAAAGFFIREEVRKAYPAETEDTFSDPRMALEETKKALMMISNSFNKAHKEAAKIEMFNEAEQKIQGKQVDQKKVNI